MSDRVREPDARTLAGNTDSSSSRRRFLAVLGGSGAVALAGCLGGDNRPRYEPGSVNETVENDSRSAAQLATAEAYAQQDPDDSVGRLDALELREHEYVVRDDYRGPTVRGVVENTGDDRTQSVEVRVRVYDDDGRQLGLYLDSTSDLDGGATWAFEVIILASPTDVADYDIAVFGV